MPVITLILLWYQRGIHNISFCLSPPLIFLFLLLVWGGLSFFWAIQPTVALKTFLTVSLTFVFFLVFISILLNATPDLILKAYSLLKISGFILIFILISQLVIDEFHLKIFSNYKGPYMMKPSGSILGLCSFVGCGLLWIYKNRVLSISTFILLILLIYLTSCQTAFYGIILACLVFILSYMAPFWITRVAMLSSYTFLVLSPLIYLHLFPLSLVSKLTWVIKNTSLFHRFLGWDFLSEKFLDRPFLGWGIEATRHLPTEPELATGYSNVIHPHNNSIQAYVELGLVGGVLFAFLFASFFWLVEKHVKDRLSVAVCNATLAFGFVQAEVTHNLWHNYWISWVALITGFIVIFLKVREAQLLSEAGHSKQFLAQPKEWEPLQSSGKMDGQEGAAL
jgi:exopolysaccharide production protein ExoQ